MSTEKNVAWLFTGTLYEAAILSTSCPKDGSLGTNVKSNNKGPFPDLCLPVRVALLQAENDIFLCAVTSLTYKMSEQGPLQCTCVQIPLEWNFLDTAVMHVD